MGEYNDTVGSRRHLSRCSFLRATAECFARLSYGQAFVSVCVCVCVCHTLQPYQNGAS